MFLFCGQYQSYFNHEPKDGTVVGKAFDFCDQEDCTIPVFVALS